MTFARFALRHGKALGFLSLVCAVGGVLTLQGMSKAVYPEVSFPREQVVAALPGTSAPLLEVSVTRPLEAALTSIPGVQRIRSRTIRGAVELSLFFASDTDMAQAHQLVLARLAEARGNLPSSTDVTAERVLPSGFPILSLNVEGPYPAAQLYELAQYTLLPALSGLPGVGKVSVQTSDLPEVQVLLDPQRLAAAHLTVSQVAERLRRTNSIEAVARLGQEHELDLAVVSGALGTVESVGEVVVGGGPDAPVRVADIGRVTEGVVPRVSLIRTDGKPGVILNVARRLGGDILTLDSAAMEVLAQLKPTLPPGVNLVPVYQQATFVRDALAGVRDALLFGSVFAVVVLALFLRDWRATLLAALSLPLTLGASFLALRALGQTLNLMTLGGLAVAVGLVIDDAVVVIEAIHAHLESGLAPAEAAARGTEELFWPIVGTTATTLVVFLPLTLLGGVAGQFFQALSLSLGAAVFLSLPIALAVLPPLAARFLRPVQRPSIGHGLASAYARGLERVLGWGPRPVLALVPLVALAAWGLLRLPSDFLPEADEGSYVIDYFAPVAASLQASDALATEIETVVQKTPEVAAFSRRLGAELGPATATLSSRGDVAVRLKQKRGRSVEEIMDAQRVDLERRVPGLRVEFVQVLSDMLGDLQGSAEPIDLKIYGPAPEQLQALAREAAGRLRGVTGLVDFFDGNEGCVPETRVEVDRLQSGRQDLSALDVATQLSAGFLGETSTKLYRPDHLEGVRVRMDYPDLPGLEVLESSQVISPSGARIPVPALSTTTSTCTAAQLLRENQRNYVHLTSRLSGVSLGSAVQTVRTRLGGWTLPLGYHWELGGLVEQQTESARSMATALGLALAAVATVLLFQLRSWRRTGAVLLAAPLSLVGGIASLWLSGTSLNVSSMMGAILLVGLVVKNGILLVDHAAQEEERGVPMRQALVAAGRARLRPILMTTLATLVALLPLLMGIGAGSELHKPLAVVVVGGLVFSTIATLFLVPALLRWFSGRDDHAGSP